VASAAETVSRAAVRDHDPVFRNSCCGIDIGLRPIDAQGRDRHLHDERRSRGVGHPVILGSPDDHGDVGLRLRICQRQRLFLADNPSCRESRFHPAGETLHKKRVEGRFRHLLDHHTSKELRPLRHDALGRQSVILLDRERQRGPANFGLVEYAGVGVHDLNYRATTDRPDARKQVPVGQDQDGSDRLLRAGTGGTSLFLAGLIFRGHPRTCRPGPPGALLPGSFPGDGWGENRPAAILQ